jgi:hypothetical protein
MKFSEIDSNVQDKIVDMLNNHIAATVNILKQDRHLIPMLMIPDTKQLVSLQSKDGTIDVDGAYAAVINKLRNEDFTYALFSYSSKIGLVNGKVIDALKTYIFTKDGLEVSFYTPFEVKGIFKKVINVEKSMLAEIKENIFE